MTLWAVVIAFAWLQNTVVGAIVTGVFLVRAAVKVCFADLSQMDEPPGRF